MIVEIDPKAPLALQNKQKRLAVFMGNPWRYVGQRHDGYTKTGDGSRGLSKNNLTTNARGEVVSKERRKIGKKAAKNLKA